MPKYPFVKKIKDERGLWLRIYATTRQELDAKVAARLAEIEQARKLTGNPLVWQYAAAWYDRLRPGLSAKRLADYANALNNHICPVIGQLHVAEVMEADAERVMDAIADKSQSLQSKVACTLRRMFASARKAGLTERTPCAELKVGGAKPKEKFALTRPQQSALLDAVTGTPVEGFVRLGLYAGLRREEALGLRWDCVDLSDAAPHIKVRRALRWEHNQPQVEDWLKSRNSAKNASRRDIPIPPQLVDWLKAEKATGGSDYVVHNRDGGPCSETTFRNYWRFIERRTAGLKPRRVKKPDGSTVTETLLTSVGDLAPNSTLKITLDFDVTPHILRHTYATELVMSGTNIKTVQYLLGHASIQLTLDIYTHIMGRKPEDNIDAVRAAFA